MRGVRGADGETGRGREERKVRGHRRGVREISNGRKEEKGEVEFKAKAKCRRVAQRTVKGRNAARRKAEESPPILHSTVNHLYGQHLLPTPSRPGVMGLRSAIDVDHVQSGCGSAASGDGRVSSAVVSIVLTA